MKKTEIKGSWELRGDGIAGAIEATVPGCVHTDLVNAGLLGDIFYRDNSKKQNFIENGNYTYTCKFEAEAKEGAKLVFEGLDTYCDVYLNGTLIGKCDNMFTPHVLDATSLTDGENTLEVRFRSPIREVEGLPLYNAAFTAERLHTRRIQCTYGWDWVDRFVTMGIYAPVYIAYPDGIYVDDVYIVTEHIDSFGAQIYVQMNFADYEVGALAQVRIIAPDGVCVADTEFFADMPRAVRRFDIRSPKLWYPRGYGDHPLYSLNIKVGESEFTEKFGIRTLRVLELPDLSGSENKRLADASDETVGGKHFNKDERSSGFAVVVNGERIFVRGANFVPCEPLPSTETDEKLCAIVKSAADMGVNLLRVWGGGRFERRAFYDECDRQGVLVAHDFMMACGDYPEHQESFIAALRHEALFAVKYLRNHPSLAFWHGDNENATRGSDKMSNYTGRASGLFGIAPVIYEHDFSRKFLPSSPYGGDRYASVKSGTTHTTNFIGDSFVYFDECDLTDYKEYLEQFYARFISEEPTFGAASRPTMLKMMTEDDLISDESEEMLFFHTKNNPSLEKHIFTYMRSAAEKIFGAFKSGEDKFFKYKYLQYEWVRVVFENARRHAGYCDGIVFWMFNDCWPAALGWSFLDYYMLEKPAYYAFRRCAKPLSASVRPSDNVGYTVTLSSDSEREYEVEITLTLLDGERGFAPIGVENSTVRIKGYGAHEVYFDCSCAGNIIALCDVKHEGGSDRCFYKEGKLPLYRDDSSIFVERQEGSVRIKANGYVHAVELEGECRFSDNYFSLLGGEEITVKVEPIGNDQTYTVSAYKIEV